YLIGWRRAPPILALVFFFLFQKKDCFSYSDMDCNTLFNTGMSHPNFEGSRCSSQYYPFPQRFEVTRLRDKCLFFSIPAPFGWFWLLITHKKRTIKLSYLKNTILFAGKLYR